LGKDDEKEKALLTSARVLEKAGNEQMMGPLVLVVDSLVQTLISRDKNEEAEHWVRLSVKLHRDTYTESNNPGLLESYCESLITAGIVFSNLGLFKESEESFIEVMDKCYENFPASLLSWTGVEWYSNTLYQQGKFNHVIELLEEFRKKLNATLTPSYKKLSESALPLNLAYKAITRIASFYFTVEKFDDTEKYLLMAEELAVQNKLPQLLTLQYYVDLATLYWEKGLEDKARKIESDLLTRPAASLTALPFTRSQYLYTMEARVVDKKFKLVMRVNRTPPTKKKWTEKRKARGHRTKASKFLSRHLF